MSAGLSDISLFSEEGLRLVMSVLVRLVEASGAVVIFGGATSSFLRFAHRTITTRRAEAFAPIRLDLGRFLALGLEFQLAADLLRTAVTPSFDEIGKLGAVAAIRTALNFFLGREIKAERADLNADSERTG